MAQIRTKKQKVAQSIKREQRTYSLADALKTTSHTTAKVVAPTTGSTQDMFGYSVELIKQDLLKTLVIGLIIVAILIGIVVWAS